MQDKWYMCWSECDVVESFGIGVKIELDTGRGYFEELLPLAQKTGLSLDEIGQVGWKHGQNVFDF